MQDYMSEQEQWEYVKTWIKDNGTWIVAGIALGAAILVGWRWWQARVDRLALEAATQYEQVLQAFNRGDRKNALGLVDTLESEHSRSPYADQANLAAARMLVESGELAPAAERLRKVMEQTKDRELGLIARLRLARVQLAQGKPDDALATLNTPDVGAFGPRYQEVRGDAYLAKGDKEAALREYRAARVGAVRQVVDTQMLDLKINDLLPPGPVAKNEPSTAAAEK